VKAAGLTAARRSEHRPSAENKVLLLDTIGELNLCYHLGSVAFVGGTLAALGGHNLLEPALAGSPVVHGPHYFNQVPAAESLQRHDLGLIASNESGIYRAVMSWLETEDNVIQNRVERLRAASAKTLDNYVDSIVAA
jgi:3-deoxy-D-manno-octulosonic-acid transferase